MKIIKKAQIEDLNIKVLLEAKKAGRVLKMEENDEFELKVLKKQQKKLKVNEQGILIRMSNDREQLVLPRVFRARVYQELHVDMGH